MPDDETEDKNNSSSINGPPISNYVLPKWIYVFISLVLGIGIIGYFHYSRFYLGIIGYKKSITCVSKGDFNEAERLIKQASELIPESKEINAFQEYISGLKFYMMADINNSLVHLKAYQEYDNKNNTVNSMVLMLEISIAFEKKDYVKMETHARSLNKLNENDPMSMLQLASSIACRYTTTGNNVQYNESKKLINDALKLNNAEEFIEYAERILYRLEKREIITQEEYILRKNEGRL